MDKETKKAEAKVLTIMAQNKSFTLSPFISVSFNPSLNDFELKCFSTSWRLYSPLKGLTSITALVSLLENRIVFETMVGLYDQHKKLSTI